VYDNAISLPYLIRRGALLLVALSICSVLSPSRSAAQPIADSSLPSFHIMIDGAGFIPFNSSYRINYESSLVGMPIELSGGFDFPVNQSFASALMVRYRRRTALYVSDLSISTIEIEPGIRAFLEKSHPKDLRLYGSGGFLLIRSTVSGVLQATKDGSPPTLENASKDYYNIGIGLGLGVEYALDFHSSFYAGLKVGVYLANSIKTGGLGNAGGLSLGIGYRYAFY
jgi:hypothetical protein